MNTTLSIGTYFGIPVKLHWTFFLILFMIAFIATTYELTSKEILMFSATVLILFFSVVLHEYGHALMARKYQIKTHDILLSPIGGLARLERIPKKSSLEIRIALAGPLVNAFIALLLFVVLLMMNCDNYVPLDDFSRIETPIEFIKMVFFLNVVLFVFNLIPAFPMDGGRVLRALLAYKLDYTQATIYAANVGRVLAGCFFIYGIYSNSPSLPIISIFIIMMANNEVKMATKNDEVLIED